LKFDVSAVRLQPQPVQTGLFSFYYAHLPRRGAIAFNSILAVFAALLCAGAKLASAESGSDPAWRRLPLVKEGKVDASWFHVGWGGFVVDDGFLRTNPAGKGLGLLVYEKERLGNCQIRVVFKAREARCNSGIYVRLSDGILDQVNNPGAAFDRDASGKISKASLDKVQASGEREEGPWYAVHHGYEVQIADTGDPLHRTAAIYSLARSSAVLKKAGEWRTMIITLAGETIAVELDGKRVTTFDSTHPDEPARKQWHEPKREPRRPIVGYIGLQNHDPGDIVWFKEVSVRPLPSRAN
jgi:hypothetical protein